MTPNDHEAGKVSKERLAELLGDDLLDRNISPRARSDIANALSDYQRLAAENEKPREGRDEADHALIDKYRNPRSGVFSFPGDVAAIIRRLEAAESKLAEAVKELEWYGEQTRLCRLIHREGDAGRDALASDGGKRARTFITSLTPADGGA